MTGTTRFTIGDIAVTALVDEDCMDMDLTQIFPAADPRRLDDHDWLEPDYVDRARGLVKLGMHSFLLSTPTLNILVDTCIGEHKDRPKVPDWHQRANSRFLPDLRDAGLGVEDIDLVFCTHLHGDHVGWNTQLVDGRWTPTFPNARYALSAREMQTWEEKLKAGDEPPGFQAYQDSVLPIVAANQAMLVGGGDEIASGLSLQSLAGHTPDHLGLDVASRSDHALFCGDAIHSPVQLIAPDWHSAFCDDPGQANVTRREMLSMVASENILLCPAHFRGDRAIRIRADGEGFRPRF